VVTVGSPRQRRKRTGKAKNGQFEHLIILVGVLMVWANKKAPDSISGAVQAAAEIVWSGWMCDSIRDHFN
jgi:hypothetical protein